MSKISSRSEVYATSLSPVAIEADELELRINNCASLIINIESASSTIGI
jgi:hypothetical protein